MLLDSNIIIYATQPHYAALRQFVAEHAPAVSVISYIEVLGYHRLAEHDRHYLEAFFDAAVILPLTENVAQWAVALRQRRRITLGDSIIAATAIAHSRVLVTHNTRDFNWIDELTLFDPLAPET